MFPVQLAGLALAGRILLSKYNKKTVSNKGNKQFKLRLRIKPLTGKRFTSTNPLQALFQGLASNLSRAFQKPLREDYNAIVKGFLPANAQLLTPQYPVISGEIQHVDVDGDSIRELIASYKANDEIKTIILKKQNGKWIKAAEAGNPGYDTINYRGVANITGEDRKQLLLGLTSTGRVPTLYGYSLENKGINKLFTQNYHKFEVLRSQGKGQETAGKARLAIWNEKDAGIYDIDVLQWNGTQLESSENIASYYLKSVIPYHARKLGQTPYNPSNWYNLADALKNVGAHKDALIATEVGMNVDKKSEFKERFMALRSEITGK